MATFSVHELLHKRALITRASASPIRQILEESSATGDVTLDFAGVEAVTPSFVDEVLAVVENALAQQGRKRLRVIFLNPPTRLSSKFAAIGRARHLEVRETEDGAWLITTAADAVP